MASSEDAAGSQGVRELLESRGVYLQEVILENFMSHQYSRIPLRPGINVVTGPNGAGKSSILLGISVALGQTYTERGERLSDLIRKGKEIGRVTVILNNSEIGGKRPIAAVNMDQVAVTRYIKSTGDYWHHVNNRFRPKAEVDHLLSQLGLNPENMLIIMHQNMIEQFAARTSEEKLQMVEDAVGAAQLRRRVIEAEDRLNALLSEEEALKRALDEAKTAVEFWREEYEKLLQLRKLHDQKTQLEIEHVWSIVIGLELNVQRLTEKIASSKAEVLKLTEGIASAEEEVETQKTKFNSLLVELRENYFSLLDQKLKQLNPASIKSDREEIDKLRSEILETEKKIISAVDRMVEKSVRLELLRHKKRAHESELRRLESDFQQVDSELKLKTAEAELKGRRVETARKPQEILEDIRVLLVQIASLGQVSTESEDMYVMADAKYRETELKAEQLSENIKKALEEIEHRKELWRKFLRNLIYDVEPTYNDLLEHVEARGRLALRNLEDIRNAELDLYVGFRGVEATLLDARTQSGGERIVATLAFLLALQRHVRSAFRAVDEFDVHLDPLNRDRMVRLLLNTAASDPGVQYILITPGRVKAEDSMNIVLVQNVSGKSSISVARK